MRDPVLQEFSMQCNHINHNKIRDTLTSKPGQKGANFRKVTLTLHHLLFLTMNQTFAKKNLEHIIRREKSCASHLFEVAGLVLSEGALAGVQDFCQN